jgi:large subunit ribosomal protein L23
MPILDVFKKKKGEEKPREIKKEKLPEPVEVRPPQAKREKIIGEAYPVRKSKISNGAYRILKTPQVTEKATDLVKKNQYVFKVYSRVNKVEIKKAIEDLYGVDVVSVKIINVPKKRRRLGRISGWRKGYKKAIVKIKEGQKIEVLPR